jgi:hypothetical protein
LCADDKRNGIRVSKKSSRINCYFLYITGSFILKIELRPKLSGKLMI